MTLHTASYTQARNAYAAARKAGLDHTALKFVRTADDRWTWEVPTPAAAPAVAKSRSAARAEARRGARAARDAAVEVVRAASPATAEDVRSAVDTPEGALQAPLYKQFASRDRSTILSPFKYVHSWLDKYGEVLSRRDAVFALVSAGVNYSTARTQYQVWHKRRTAGR